MSTDHSCSSDLQLGAYLALLQQRLVEEHLFAHAPPFEQQQLLLCQRLRCLRAESDVRSGAARCTKAAAHAWKAWKCCDCGRAAALIPSLEHRRTCNLPLWLMAMAASGFCQLSLSVGTAIASRQHCTRDGKLSPMRASAACARLLPTGVLPCSWNHCSRTLSISAWSSSGMWCALHSQSALSAQPCLPACSAESSQPACERRRGLVACPAACAGCCGSPWRSRHTAAAWTGRTLRTQWPPCPLGSWAG